MNDGNKAQLLYKAKFGAVCVEIRGPRLGWEWTTVTYFRWKQSSNTPGKWEKVLPDREGDQAHLEKAVKAVRAWYRAREKERAKAWRAA